MHSFLVCTNNHRLIKDNRYYTCVSCKTYFIGQPSLFCNKCMVCYCLVCKHEEYDKISGMENCKRIKYKLPIRIMKS